MYRPVRRPRRAHLGQTGAQPSPWPVLIAGGVVFGLGLGLVAWMGTRTARMQDRARSTRRWG